MAPGLPIDHPAPAANVVMHTFYSAHGLVRHVQHVAAEFDVVSFDLFDTLAVRRIADPDDLKPSIARRVAAEARQRGIDLSWETFQQARDAVEQAHRERNGQSFPDREARYPDFMAEALGRFFAPPDVLPLLETITDYELSQEGHMLVARAALAGLLQDLHDMGKRVWVLTDVYLPSPHINRLLTRLGLAEHVDLVVSSADTFRAKASGTVYADLQAAQGVDPARWLHIGDNPVSDGARADEKGLTAFILKDTAELHRKRVYRTYARLAQTRRFWKGRLAQQLMLPLDHENRKVDPLYALGYHFFGPLIGAFLLRLAERVTALRLQRIYFFSREGHVLLEAWNRMAPHLFPAGDAPEARYLHVSRRGLAQAACARRGLSYAHTQIAMLPAKNRDFRDICRIFGLAAEPLVPHLRRHHLELDTCLNAMHAGWTPETRTRLRKLVADRLFRDAVKHQAAPAGQLAERYLEQEGFFDQRRVAVVDMGWLGTIQRFLRESVLHRPDAPAIRGFLLGATRGGVPFPTRRGNRLEGLVYDRKRFDLASSTVGSALSIFEESCRAPHGGVLGYEEDGDRARPRLAAEDSAERVAERRQDAHYAPLQRGLIDGAERFGAAVTTLGLRFIDVRPWINHLLVTQLAFPRPDEVERLKWKHHGDDFEGKHRPPFLIRLSQRQLWDLPPWCFRVPGVRLGFYIWNGSVLPICRALLIHSSKAWQRAVQR